MIDKAGLSIFVATTAYLFLKMFANTGAQAAGRLRYKSYKYREDEPFFGTKFDEQPPQPEYLTRAEGAWRNDLENIPIFLFAALCGLLSGLPLGTYKALCIAFCAARTLHTVFLLSGLQPWRFICYFVGVVSTGAMFATSLHALGW